MLKDGYQQGTRIRLMSCWTGLLEDGAAQQLSNLANAMVVAPTNKMIIGYERSFLQFGKPYTSPWGGVFKIFLPK